MDLHQLRPTTRKKKEKRIGRGGKRGTTSGRGTKGQKSRSGHRIRPAVRDLMMKIPQKRGIGFKVQSGVFAIIDLTVLENNFKAGEKVSPKMLAQRGLVESKKGKTPRVKVLGEGRLTKKLILEGLAVSQSAGKRVLGLGGEIRNIGH